MKNIYTLWWIGLAGSFALDLAALVGRWHPEASVTVAGGLSLVVLVGLFWTGMKGGKS